MVKIYKIALSSIFLLVLPLSAWAATLSVSPASGTFEVGDRIVVKIAVSSGAPINAVSGIVSFPTSLFSIESVSKAGSILNFWVSEPNFSAGAGTLQFEGVTLGGFPGGTGTVVTATLRAMKPGSGAVSFTSGQVLANDGEGTDVTDGLSGATFSVEPVKIQSQPAPVSKPEPIIPEVSQPAPSLNSPAILVTSKYGAQAISGTSDYPGAEVLLTFISESGIKIFITGKTDEKGEFILLVPQTLKHGLYQVSAVVIQADTSSSHVSNEITVTIGNIVSDIGSGVFSWILLLILALLYLIVRSYYYLKKNKKLKAFVRGEAKEAEEIVHKSFKLLREDATDSRQIKKDLDEAEELISKEIKDIEKS